ncbi:MAG: hypothetical protein IH793_01205 [Acidobacteria bacterium]|nr:hypothetical protein [Acidobacteriota bacterium]
MIELLGLTLDQLRRQAVAWDLPAYCGNQLYHALYVERRWQFDQMRLFENDGTGTYTEVASERGIFDTGSGKGLLTFDYDLDGDLDLTAFADVARRRGIEPRRR